MFKEVLPECGVSLWGLRCGHNVFPCGSGGVEHRPYGDAMCPVMDGGRRARLGERTGGPEHGKSAECADWSGRCA